jgi:hypothetical protein
MEAQTKSEEITTRYFEPERDYEEFSAWQKAHSMPVLPEWSLPEVGVVAESGGYPVAAGFMYCDHSAHFGFPTFVVVNPLAAREVRSTCIDRVIEELIETGKQLGIRLFWTATNHKSLGERFKRQGFVVTDKESTEYSMPIGGE